MLARCCARLAKCLVHVSIFATEWLALDLSMFSVYWAADRRWLWQGGTGGRRGFGTPYWRECRSCEGWDFHATLLLEFILFYFVAMLPSQWWLSGSMASSSACGPVVRSGSWLDVFGAHSGWRIFKLFINFLAFLPKDTMNFFLQWNVNVTKKWMLAILSTNNNYSNQAHQSMPTPANFDSFFELPN